MVTPMKAPLLAALFLAGMTLAAAAQVPYPAPPPYTPAPAISPAQAYPPSWSYDPYTSGQAPCPQKRPGDTQSCSQIMPPTYGQPSYWPTH
jgi:hypothetical protein